MDGVADRCKRHSPTDCAWKSARAIRSDRSDRCRGSTRATKHRSRPMSCSGAPACGGVHASLLRCGHSMPCPPCAHPLHARARCAHPLITNANRLRLPQSRLARARRLGGSTILGQARPPSTAEAWHRAGSLKASASMRPPRRGSARRRHAVAALRLPSSSLDSFARCSTKPACVRRPPKTNARRGPGRAGLSTCGACARAGFVAAHRSAPRAAADGACRQDRRCLPTAVSEQRRGSHRPQCLPRTPALPMTRRICGAEMGRTGEGAKRA